MAKHESDENAKARGNYTGKHRRVGDERQVIDQLRTRGGAFRIDRGKADQRNGKEK